MIPREPMMMPGTMKDHPHGPSAQTPGMTAPRMLPTDVCEFHRPMMAPRLGNDKHILHASKSWQCSTHFKRCIPHHIRVKHDLPYCTNKSLVHYFDTLSNQNVLQIDVPTGSPSCRGNVTVYYFDISKPSLSTPFCSVLMSISVFLDLSNVFHSINSPHNSPLSHSVVLVLSLPYQSFQLLISL